MPIRLRNLSTRGALLDGRSLPQAGASVRLLRGELSADGQIAWDSNGHAGIRFTREIDVDAWVKHVGHPGQQRVDEALAALRSQRPPLANDTQASVSIASISGELDGICERLANLSPMSTELGEELMKLDALAHALRPFAGDC